MISLRLGHFLGNFHGGIRGNSTVTWCWVGWPRKHTWILSSWSELSSLCMCVLFEVSCTVVFCLKQETKDIGCLFFCGNCWTVASLMFEVENDIRLRFVKVVLFTDSNSMHHVWHWFTSESPDSKRPLTWSEYRSFLQDPPCWLVDVFAIVLCWMLKVPPASNMKDTEGKVYLKIFNYVEMLMVFESFCFFAKRMYSLKVFRSAQICNLFLGISRFTVFWWPQSPWVVRLATRDGWSRRFRRGGGLSRHRGPPSCQGPTLLQRGFGTQLNTHVIYSPENSHVKNENGTHVFLKEIYIFRFHQFCSGHVSFQRGVRCIKGGWLSHGDVH